jgi:hypothetical protein
VGGRALARPQQKAADDGRTIVWGDEAGCYRLPMAVRTWAPRRQTPVLRVKVTHDHLAAISGITLDGRLCLKTRQTRCDSAGVVSVLQVLLHKLPGKLLISWDGAPMHQGQPIQDFLTRGAAKRLHLERLPGDAPDLHPDEGIWNYLKRVELKHRCCRDLPELQRAVRRAAERLRRKRELIRSCSAQCGYSV